MIRCPDAASGGLPGMRGFSRLLLASLTGLCLLQGCAPAASETVPAFRASGNWFLPPSFHGNAWSQGGDGSHLPFVYEPLFLYEPADKRYLPLLGLSASAASDRKTFTVKLRPEARWHDGRPFTAADVKSSFLLYWLQGWGGTLANIETPDPQTVVFKWFYPFNPIEERQMRVQRIQAPMHLFGEWARQAELLLAERVRIADMPQGPAREARNEKLLVRKSELLQKAFAFRPETPIGTNAYKVDQVTASEMVLKRYPQSWHKGVSVPEVRLLRASTNDVMWAYLLGGDVDASHAATPPDVAEQMRSLNPRLRQLNLPDYINFGYSLNRKQAPLDDLRFREALALLLDRDRVRRIASYYSLTSDDRHIPLMMADGKDWMPPGLEAKLKHYPYDPKQAEALLQAGGYKRDGEGNWLRPDNQPIRFEIAVINGYSDWVLASESVAAQMTRFGLPTQVRTYDSALYFQQLRGGNFQIAAAFGTDFKLYTHPAVSLDRFFAKAGILAKAAGLPESMNGPAGTPVDLQRAVETVMGDYDKKLARQSLADLLWLANRELPFLSVFEKKIGVFVQEGERVSGWPAESDPVWSLTAMGLDATYAYLLSSGRLKVAK